MLSISRQDVNSAPFPHVVKQGILDAELFTRMRADFPTSQLFESQHAETGSTGSRVGSGTGFDIYRGDAEYDRLISGSSAWAEFDAYINSRRFVEKFIEVFGPDLDALDCAITVRADAYDRDFVEGREVLTEKQSLGERVRSLVPSFATGGSKPAKLFSRLDIEKSLGGYAKPPHCDRGNRLASLIIYFSDLEKAGIEGGELNIYAHKDAKPMRKYERHPKPENVDVVATLSPKENLGVFFPCCNNSYHGVNAVKQNGKARDFLYINISGDVASCWN